MATVAEISDWAPATTPPTRIFYGHEDVLRHCRLAWGLNDQYTPSSDADPERSRSLHFRLEGPPGVGKNAVVYEMARRMKRPLYVMTGHEEMTPEDLSILVVPAKGRGMRFELNASPLATAIYEGAIFFFDEINRVPERALSPLSSVLDERQKLVSAMTSIEIIGKDDDARRSFRFCCALNPALSDSGKLLPEYIEDRLLPVIAVPPPSIKDLQRILEGTLGCTEEWLDGLAKTLNGREDLSVRQALSLMTYAMREWSPGRDPGGILGKVLDIFLRTPQRSASEPKLPSTPKPSSKPKPPSKRK